MFIEMIDSHIACGSLNLTFCIDKLSRQAQGEEMVFSAFSGPQSQLG